MDANFAFWLGVATLLPLASFALILIGGTWLGKSSAGISIAAIVFAGVISFAMLFVWLGKHPPAHHGSDSAEHFQQTAAHHARQGHESAKTEDHAKHGSGGHGEEGHATVAYAGDYYQLGKFGRLRLSIGYYVDTLTICMFCMVTQIASCIHFYAVGYMHEELSEVTDHEVVLRDGSHLHRPGRFPRFFQYMSLFCFSMLGLVLAGNIAMVFVFWELVGICSYFLIGFYVERTSACVAANKAFIVNRVGDFGMIVGLMVVWTCMGTFAFGDMQYDGVTERGIFSQVRPAPHHQLSVPDGMILAGMSDAFKPRARAIYRGHLADRGSRDERSLARDAQSQIAAEARQRDEGNAGYWLLIIAGVGIFCGCVGKSAQFPLHVWLPDAMEGPTPVSALVHSATMVAAGVYLVGRFYPVFAPEVLLLIAIVGAITLFMAATIAITATDIKRVLAYSTVSQLGYMMMALGVGGWVAGMMHLITHAFFKSLLFLCSGSVIHAVHTNEMPQMGGLFKKMPITAITMLVGCLAIIGASLPLVVGLSGYYSKDAILEQAAAFLQFNQSVPWSAVFFLLSGGGAAITAFYMFRMWFSTFLGEPRDPHRHEHAHESPKIMYVPLVVLSVFAVSVAWKPLDGVIGSLVCAVIAVGFALPVGLLGRTEGGHAAGRPLVWLPAALSLFVFFASLVWLSQKDIYLANLLEQARPAGTAPLPQGEDFPPAAQAKLLSMSWPSEHYIHDSHEFSLWKKLITLGAFGAGIVGVVLAASLYVWRLLDPTEMRSQFKSVYRFLLNKWWFDEIYDATFVRATHIVARLAAQCDRRYIDGLIDGLARVTRSFASAWDYVVDRGLVDGFFNVFAGWTYSLGSALREVQRGKLREYVMFIVLGTILIFVLVSFF